MKEEINKILRTVCVYYAVDLKDVLKKSRLRETVQTRQIAHYMCKKHTRYSDSVIGFDIGMKDRCTVIYSHSAVEDRLSWDKQFKLEIEELNLKIRVELSHQTYTIHYDNVDEVHHFCRKPMLIKY